MMNLENFVAVSGLPGLYKMIGNRKNGLLVQDLDKGTTRFCSVRKHQFTPLETCSIYTDADTTALKDIFMTMETMTPIDINSKSEDLHAYFRKVLPEYDEDRVYISDIKKVIKWYNFLKERDLLVAEVATEEVAEVAEEVKEAVKAKKASKGKKAVKKAVKAEEEE